MPYRRLKPIPTLRHHHMAVVDVPGIGTQLVSVDLVADKLQPIHGLLYLGKDKFLPSATSSDIQDYIAYNTLLCYEE